MGTVNSLYYYKTHTQFCLNVMKLRYIFLAVFIAAAIGSIVYFAFFFNKNDCAKFCGKADESYKKLAHEVIKKIPSIGLNETVDICDKNQKDIDTERIINIFFDNLTF